MTPERWQVIDELFHAALGRNAAERSDFLAHQCGSDEQLRHEVESLLLSHERADNFIETPAGDVAADLLGTHKSTFEPSQQIENYCIIRQLGLGGMGEVYLAEDTRLKRKVALKLLPPRFTVNPERVRRFEREARAASTLNHPNIVTIYEIRQSGSMHFIATEFVDGKTLRQLINEEPLKLTDILNVAIQVADALSGAHAAGIIHRDVKPENIMIHQQGYVKVLDFGLAKLNEQQAADADPESPTLLQSNPGLVMGTVQYMSPEQARGKNVGMRSDIWSLGIVLYEMLAGHVPFEGETPSHVMVSLMENEPQPLKSHAHVPEELDRIVGKALRKDQHERYQTANHFARDLRDLRNKLKTDSRLSSWLSTVPSRREEPIETTDLFSSKTCKTAPMALASLTASSGEYLVDRIKQSRRFVLAALLVLAVSAIVVGYRFWVARRGVNKPIQSIAVMPFSNVANNSDVEYLSDGLTDSLTNNLSPLAGLTVISRTSSFKYKGKEVDPKEVARTLGVDAIVTGRITQLSDEYLISVELVDARDRRQIWGKQYNGYSSDLLKVMVETSKEITRELRLRLTQAEERQLTQMSNLNPQAYDWYLRGQAVWDKGGTDNRKLAAEYYNRAIATDQGYALAYTALASAYSNLITNNELEQKEFAPKAEAAARKAVELDDNLAEAHLTLANMSINKWEWNIAESEIKRTLELNPNLAQAHRVYGKYLLIHGRPEEAVAEGNSAQELDPLGRSAKQHRLDTLWLYRKWDEALELAKQMLELDPNNPDKHFMVGWLNVHLGRNQAAIESYLEAIRLGDKSGDAQIMLAQAYAFAGDRNEARQILTRFESGKEYASPFSLSVVYLALDDRDKAFASLESAYEQHDQQLIWLRSAWDFDPIRTDPRYESLVRRIGL
ncbi:MAG: hypothetical protein C5B55_01740 [Blastocatellia bacterium]|nr:MAG: hypothetical protein C5B55_01740 [Blastocatellia bacterium]